MDGEATAENLATLRPHIRTCLSCRAALREYRSAPATAAALVPVAAFAVPGRAGLPDLPARVAEVLAGWSQKAQAATELATAQKVAAVAASTAVLGGGAAVTVHKVEPRAEPPKPVAQLQRPKQTPPPAARAPSTTSPVVTPPPEPPLSEAEREARKAERKTPPAHQEFEPAWAAGEPAPDTETTAASASTSTSSASEPPPSQPTGSGGGAEEFAP